MSTAEAVVPPPNPLSAKEVVVLRMLAMGLQVKQIGRRLGVEHEAISNRIARAKRKLRTKTTVHTVVVAVVCGYLREEPASAHVAT